MSDQLFRFSVLRTAATPEGTEPIEIAGIRQPIDDTLVGLAREAHEWMSHADLATADIGTFRADLSLDQYRAQQDQLAGLVTLYSNQLISDLTQLADGSDQPARRSLVEHGDLVSVAALLSQAVRANGGVLEDRMLVADWISKHPIQLGPNAVPVPGWKPRRALVREPAIADHYVVRQTLAGYQTGEIEDIKNYLKGESKKHTLRHLTVDEEEVVAETETQTTRTEESSTQQRANMKSAAQSEANSSMGFDARVKTDGQYGPTKVNTDVGFQYSSSTKESAQTASEFSSEVLARSVEEVKSRELNRVTRRHRSEIEELRDHRVDNTDGSGHVVGIYRWVDSVWNAKTYRIGRRLILEFLIPQPGKAILDSRKHPPAYAVPAPEAPPANLFDILTDGEAAKYAARYGVDGIEPEPLPFLVMGVPFKSAEFKDNEGPRVIGISVTDLKVPDGYVGNVVFVTVTTMPRTDSTEGMNVAVDVAGAKPALLLEGTAIPNPNQFGGSPGLAGRPNPDLKTLTLRSNSDFGPGATVPIAIYTEDTRGFTGFAEVHCHRSTASIDKWKLATVQKIVAAYRARLAEWESAKLAQSFEEQPDHSPLDLDALCRHVCISSLLGSWPGTAGRADTKGWPVPASLAGSTGRLIEFIEQSIEWNNLQYVVYPYYWADSTAWPELLDVEDPSPHVREFLRSGAMRVVVPVRPDLTQSMLFFLETRIPWFGGPAPIPGDDGYLSIATEIEESRTKNADEGELVSEFSYTLPTSLTILQPDGVLPAPA